MQVIIISFDSLAASALGCYGNEWIETPHWDRLAASGVVFDRHFADALGAEAGMAWSSGRQAFSPPTASAAIALGNVLKSNSIASALITVGQPRAWQQQLQFDQTIVVDEPDAVSMKPDEIPFAGLVRAARALWSDPQFQSKSRVLWLHAPSPGAPPEGFDSLYFEDFEERGQRLAELSAEQLRQHPALYGGSVSLLDHWLGELLTEIGSGDRPTLVITTAARGHRWHQVSTSAAESGDSGGDADRRSTLDDQIVRAPLVLRMSGDDRFRDFGGIRSDRLVQTTDLMPTLLDWFHLTTPDPQAAFDGQSWLKELTADVPTRTHLKIKGGDQGDAIRTVDWLCVRERAGDAKLAPVGPVVTLFAKPEDIWDVNNVAAQQLDVVHDLLQRLP